MDSRTNFYVTLTVMTWFQCYQVAHGQVPDMFGLFPSTADSTTRIVARWTRPYKKADKYAIWWWISELGSSGETHIVPSSDERVSYVITDLTPGESYDVTVAVSEPSWSGWSNQKTLRTSPSKVSRPTLSHPQARNHKTSQLHLRWSKPEGKIDGYKVKVYQGTYLLPSKTSTTSDTFKIIIRLVPGAAYTATVTAISGGVYGAESDKSNPARTGPSKVSVPTLSLPQLRNHETSQLHLSWSKPYGEVDGYQVKVYQGTYLLPSKTSTTSDTFKTIIGLEPGAAYTATVTAISGGVYGTESARSNPARTAPSKITSLNLIQSTNYKTSQLHPSWSKPYGEVDGYEVKVYQGTYLLPSKTSTTSDTSKTIIGLVPGAAYTATVTAISGGVHGAESARSNPARTDPPTPTNIKLLQPTDGDKSTQLNVTWKMPSFEFRVASYKIVLASPTSSNKSYTYDVNENSPTYYLVENLTPGGRYIATVQAVSPSIGSSATLSEVSSGTSPVTTQPSQPKFSVDDVSNNVHLTWTRPDGFIDGYILNVSGLEPIQLNASATSYIIENLDPSTEYSVGFYSFVNNQDGNIKKSSTSFNTYTTSVAQSGLSRGLVAAIVVSLLVLLLITLGLLYHRRRKLFSKSKESAAVLIDDTTQHLNTANEEKRVTCVRAVKTSEFDEYMKTMRADNDSKLQQEHSELANVGKEQSTNAALLPENISKNRYKKSIFPFDATRVKLQPATNPGSSDYINASYIPGYSKEKEYIATQGPLRTTNDDFWRMIWEQDSRNIVMLTQIVDSESGKVKCEMYWPKSETPTTVACMQLQLISELKSHDWIVRVFNLKKGEETRRITQFHFTAWPDHGVPTTAKNLTIFTRYVRRTIKHEATKTGPTIVHCSAGVGRTGTFIAMDRLLQHMKDHDYVDIFGIVHEMRMCRTSMVQNKDQYVLIHAMVQDVINDIYGDTEADPVYQNTFSSTAVYETVHFA
ncbi:receptor-type tyrosine-protein phosphatase H-like isoform X3 [Clavelina lepadiformis]|uniref:receptor-type tyrosine-protein phosphatase H-like isoform X3 n=1 Tax=Clavelina lepadiformis TaxID=159417 RepID=UPI00404103C8